jgi:hypothetical protein
VPIITAPVVSLAFAVVQSLAFAAYRFHRSSLSLLFPNPLLLLLSSVLFCLSALPLFFLLTAKRYIRVKALIVRMKSTGCCKGFCVATSRGLRGASTSRYCVGASCWHCSRSWF